MKDLSITRRTLLQAALAGIAASDSSRASGAASKEQAASLCQSDLAIDETTAMLWPDSAPLAPEPGKRDSRAVWARVLPHFDLTALVFLHGNNNYVTVDSHGRSRVPDWAADNAAASAGAAAKPAAPLAYGLDRVTSVQIGGRSPLLLLPEDAILSHGSFWANEPRGQYTDPLRLGHLLGGIRAHLACLKRPRGGAYLTAREAKATLARLYLAGHSGAGLPLQEAAASQIALPSRGIATDLWLFDCTYWSEIANFTKFCAAWHGAGRLAGGRSNSARFVCVYRPGTQTEEIADILRGDVAKALKVSPDSLVKDHSASNFASEIAPSLRNSGAFFVRTHLPHDEIPTFFIPRLIETAAA